MLGVYLRRGFATGAVRSTEIDVLTHCKPHPRLGVEVQPRAQHVDGRAAILRKSVTGRQLTALRLLGAIDSVPADT